MVRKVALETVSLAVPVSSAVLFSGGFIAGWSRPQSAAAAASVAAVAAAGFVWHRRSHPANIDPPVPVPEAPGAAEPRTDDDARWDLVTLVLLAVSLVLLVVVGMVAMFLVPILVIVGFSLTHDGVRIGDVLLALGATLGVALVLELAVALPLARRWDLDPGPPRRP